MKSVLRGVLFALVMPRVLNSFIAFIRRNALPADFRAVINYMKAGNCPVEELITKIAKPEGALEAMQEWVANPGKVFRILVEF